MLPLLVITRIYQDYMKTQLSALTIVTLALFAAYGIASTHDPFQMQRAQLAAVQELLDAHVPRNQFYAGFEYDGWTQIDEWGYVNNNQINFPPGFIPREPGPPGDTCGYGSAHFYPAIHARYGVSFTPRICSGTADFRPVTYMRGSRHMI